ncbi:MAG: CsgG/HfaB family protein [Phycisphaerales bacterium]|nr:CsgG/HfaB family protein [Phycisphaerales bacterium]
MNPTRMFIPFLSTLLAVSIAMPVRADLGIEFQMPVLAGLYDIDESESLSVVQQPAAVQQVMLTGFERPVTEAATAQDAINAAASRLRMNNTDGAAWVDVHGRIGVVASGTSSWNPNQDNLQLRLYDQRFAWMKAALKAKTSMSRFIKGASVAGQERLSEELSSRDSATLSQLKSKQKSTERISSVAGAFLRGAVVYEMNEDATTGQVTVTLVSTPGTQDLSQTLGNGLSGIRNTEEATRMVMAEIRAGIVPPTGGRLLKNSVSGTDTWIAYGAEPAAPSNNEQLRNAAREAARNTARLRAQRAMLALLRGETISEEDLLDARFEDVLSQTDDLLIQTSDIESIQLSEQATDSTRASVASGQLPSGVESFGLQSIDGTWQYVVLVYDGTAGSRVQGTPTLPPPSAPANPAAPVAGNIRIVDSTGIGNTRAMAIKNALLEAVSQVNGALINGDTVTSRKYEDAIEDFNGLTNQRINAESISTESINMTSGGLVSSYRIISEGPLSANAAERDHGGAYAVQIRAEVPVFDPENPRPGARPTIAVLPLHVAKVSMPADVQRMSAMQVANSFTSAFNRDLVRSGAFTVLDERYLRTLDSKRNQMLERAANGQVNMQEILKLGHELTADFVLVGTLEDLSFKKWRQLVEIRNTYESRKQVSISLELRLINITTGEIEWTDFYRKRWDTVQLSQRSNDDRALSPVEFAMEKASASLEGSLVKYLQRLPKE